ncbi:MAG: superinfection immunity protein [Lentimicrobium sp.]|uniref:superinfection immunity protein n=1 Tax=Lentimicrobium sp. TaxID=2034841 RepID=UPI0025FEB27F|nr:superinfection immunity protein [Lentimicrobium sp.]MCO5257500.1 superinfection immunity protein [Lentimicrobium sp.]
MEFIIAPLIAVIYFLPAIVGRKHKNVTSIALLNLFLGWTVIGWIVALIWAVSVPNTTGLEQNEQLLKEQRRTNDLLSKLANSKSEELKVIQQMRMNGTLSEDEYEKLRSRIFDGLNPKSVESEKSVFNIINN